jgi:hypothetical protein
MAKPCHAESVIQCTTSAGGCQVVGGNTCA